MWAIGFALLLLGIILLISYPISKRKNARCTAQVEGVLSAIQKRHDSDGDVRHTYVYSYQVDGVKYQIKTPILSSQASGVGDACTIWHDPAKPQRAQPFHYDSNNPYRIILIVGVVLVVLGFILFMVGVVQ